MNTFDLRPLVCKQRHALIFNTFEALTVEDGFVFINDHDPQPLYRQLLQRYGDQVSWQYLETGPEVWRIEVKRTKAGKARHFEADISLVPAGSCCGHDAADEDMTLVIDVRNMPPRNRHPLIFETFDNLKPAQTFELVNDHDPKPLYYQFLHERTDQFTWEYQEQGPTTWRVIIGRQVTVQETTS